MRSRVIGWRDATREAPQRVDSDACGPLPARGRVADRSRPARAGSAPGLVDARGRRDLPARSRPARSAAHRDRCGARAGAGAAAEPGRQSGIGPGGARVVECRLRRDRLAHDQTRAAARRGSRAGPCARVRCSRRPRRCLPERHDAHGCAPQRKRPERGGARVGARPRSSSSGDGSRSPGAST